MTPTIGWVEGIPPSDKTPFVPTERFNGTGKIWRAWLLADARCVNVHYMPGQKTLPCIAHMGDCPMCLNPMWWKRTEAYAPAMLECRKKPDPEWVPFLAVFTPGGTKQLGLKPHRGKMFDIWRKDQKRTDPLVLNLLQVSDPLRPAFDIEPLIKRMWWPDQECHVELPAPIPIPPEEINREPFRPELQPLTFSAEEAARLLPEYEARGLKHLAAKARQVLADANESNGEPAHIVSDPPTPPSPTPAPAPTPPPARPEDKTKAADVEQLRRLDAQRKPDRTTTLGEVIGIILTPEEEQDAARVREAERKPANKLTAEDAVMSGRTLDYCVPDRPATIKFNGNGHGKKGGAK